MFSDLDDVRVFGGDFLSTSSADAGEPEADAGEPDLLPPEVCFRLSLSFGIFMLLKRVLSRLLLLPGVELLSKNCILFVTDE